MGHNLKPDGDAAVQAGSVSIARAGSLAQPSCAPQPSCDENSLSLPVSPIELAAMGKVLNLLERQLESINQDVEASVAKVCSGFHGMAQKAQAAVDAAQSVAASGTLDSDKEIPIVKMQSVLESLLANVHSSSQFSRDATERFVQMEFRLARVEKIVREVEKISGNAKMVAMNGRIEAARLGEAGKAFGVVAQETKDLANNVATTSLSIRESISELAAELASTIAEMKNRTREDHARFVQSDVEARGLLLELDSMHRDLLDSMQTTGQVSRELRGDVARAVMGMQFQDRVSQCVAHVVETLAEMTTRIGTWCGDVSESEAEQCYEQWRRSIDSRYTMESERLGDASKPVSLSPSLFDATGGDEVQDFSVELF